MNTKPKIFVFRMREIIYTLLLVFLVILLFVCLFLMFSPEHAQKRAQTEPTPEKTPASETAAQETGQENGGTPKSAGQPLSFTPGVYSVPVFLNDATVDVEVTVDSDHINSIRLVNLSESVEAMYPLISPSLENITGQILQRQTLDGITCPQENRYTSQLLMNAVSDALALARG